MQAQFQAVCAAAQCANGEQEHLKEVAKDSVVFQSGADHREHLTFEYSLRWSASCSMARYSSGVRKRFGLLAMRSFYIVSQRHSELDLANTQLPAHRGGRRTNLNANLSLPRSLPHVRRLASAVSG